MSVSGARVRLARGRDRTGPRRWAEADPEPPTRKAKRRSEERTEVSGWAWGVGIAVAGLCVAAVCVGYLAVRKSEPKAGEDQSGGGPPMPRMADRAPVLPVPSPFDALEAEPVKMSPPSDVVPPDLVDSIFLLSNDAEPPLAAGRDHLEIELARQGQLWVAGRRGVPRLACAGRISRRRRTGGAPGPPSIPAPERSGNHPGLLWADRKLGWYLEIGSVLFDETVSLIWAGRSMTTPSEFQTPPRILIPKLVASRDAWKAKATARKAQRKALEIRVRDLETSRDLHRQKADQLGQRVARLEAQLAAASRPGPVPAPKNATAPAAPTTTPPSSASR